MPHELEILENGQASMMYNLETGVPWHGLGEPVTGLVTADEAIVAAGLDWEVEKRPVYAKRGADFVEIPDRFEIARTTDDRTLGVVGKDYIPVQNREAFEFADSLVDSGDAKYDTAGSLSGGKRIWLAMQIGEEFQVAGQDAHRMYLTCLSSHDGSKSLSAIIGVIRVVCANTEQMAIRGAKTSWSMTHRQDFRGRVMEARESLELTFKYQEAFDKEMQRLLSVKVSMDQFQAMMKDILPKQKRQLDKNVASLSNIYENSPTIRDTGISGTGMGAYNAVTEWLTHGREVRSQEARMVNTMWGFGAQVRGKTHDRILALA